MSATNGTQPQGVTPGGTLAVDVGDTVERAAAILVTAEQTGTPCPPVRDILPNGDIAA
ncbi:hypothetical protein FrEUN1fDRAFT_4897, partial [Parafrankia sp. EUN1f]